MALFIGRPLVCLLHWRKQLWTQRRALAWVILGAIVGGWAWDALSVRWRVWYYESSNIELWMFVTDPIGGRWAAWFFDFDKTLGLTLFNVMPVEDLIGIAVTSSAAAGGVLVFGYGPRKWT